MRVLHISSARTFGGGERYLVDLANTLTRRGHDLYVAVRADSPLISELTNVQSNNLLTLPLRNALDARSAAQLASYVKRRNIEIVHAHMARDYPLAAYATRRNRNAQLVVTRHVLFPLNPLHRVTLSGVSRVIAVSQAVARQLTAQRLVAAEKVIVVHNGVDITRFETAIRAFDRAEFCRRWDLPQDGVFVGSVGMLNPLKGHEDFLKAAEKLGKMFPAAHFIIAGLDVSPGQVNRTNLERLIGELKLASRTRLIGQMDDITPLFCALDILVSASRLESFGLAIAEAMAAETAVVATETDGAREIIQEGVTGLLVKLGNLDALTESVATLLGNKEKREKMGKSAQTDIRRRFSLERMVDATEQIYRQSVSESQKSREDKTAKVP